MSYVLYNYNIQFRLGRWTLDAFADQNVDFQATPQWSPMKPSGVIKSTCLQMEIICKWENRL